MSVVNQRRKKPATVCHRIPSQNLLAHIVIVSAAAIGNEQRCGCRVPGNLFLYILYSVIIPAHVSTDLTYIRDYSAIQKLIRNYFMSEALHLFLCAVGRSGTTVFRTSLGRHPDIYYNDRENNIVMDLQAVAQTNCTVGSRKYAMVVDQARYNSIFRTAITDLIWPDAGLRNRPVQIAAINPIGDQLDYLCEVFPLARIVCLVRNGIEVVSSRMRYESFAGNEFESHCDVWNRSRSVIDWGATNEERFRLFRHEWLYSEPQIRAQLDELYSWLGIMQSDLPADNILSRLHHPTGGLSDSSSSGNNTADPEPASAKIDLPCLGDTERTAYFKSKSLRWMDWTPAQRATFESSCGSFMCELGYSIPWRDHNQRASP